MYLLTKSCMSGAPGKHLSVNITQAARLGIQMDTVIQQFLKTFFGDWMKSAVDCADALGDIDLHNSHML